MCKAIQYALPLLLLTGTASAIPLTFPVDCKLGSDCYIQQYMSDTTAANARDYVGGHLTSSNHNGTDIALPAFSQIKSNIRVVAVADGTVTAVQDNEPDHYNRNYTTNAQTNTCGNEVSIQHAAGWQSQYCHMKYESIVVKPGESVKAGQTIGYVGASGVADYPHLHLTVRQNGQVVDPFVAHLWQKPVPYHSQGLISMGVSDRVQSEIDTANDPAQQQQFSPQRDNAIVAWARAYGATQGQLQRFVFYQPNGQMYQAPFVSVITKDYPQIYSYAGYDLSDPNLPKGSWKVVYQMRTLFGSWKTLGERDFIVG